MVIKNIAKVCKNSGQVILYDNGICEQWVGDGGALYPLHGLPILTTETLLTVLDIPEAGQKKLYKDMRLLPDIFDYSDTVRGENIIPDFGLTIGEDGMVLQPAKTSRGMVFFDPRYLSPLKDAPGDIQLYERQTDDGHVYLVAKEKETPEA